MKLDKHEFDTVDAFLLIIVIVAILLNVLTLIILIQVKRKSLYLKLCLQLGISDMLQCVFGYLLEIYFTNYSSNSIELCKLSAFFVCFYGLTSITILTVISFLKTISIKKPFLVNNLNTTTSFNMLIIAFVWCYPLLWAAFPLVGWSSYTLESTQRRCSINFKAETLNEKSYIWCLMVFCFLIPVICNFVSVYIGKRIVVKHSLYCSKTYGSTCKLTLIVQRKKKISFTMSCCMLSSFLIAWTPYAAVGILSNFIVIPNWLSNTCALLAKSSAVLNPIIYCYRAKISKVRKQSFIQKFATIFEIKTIRTVPVIALRKHGIEITKV